MRLDSSLTSLFGNKAGAKPSGLADGRQMVSLLNRHASLRRGIAAHEAPGAYRPVFEQGRRTVTEDVYETRDVKRMDAVYEDRAVTEQQDVYEQRDISETRDIYEMQDVYETRDIVATRDVTETRDVMATRDITETRDVYEMQDVYETQDVLATRDVTETRDVMATRDVTETRDVYETRNIYETRAVYEDHAIMATEVDGNRSLTPYNSLSQAGIDVGGDFSIKVGNGPTAVLRFDQSQRLSVIVDGQTTRFTFTGTAGSMRSAILAGLNSISGLDASYTSDGKLHLATENAESLQIADVANAFLDFSRSPLAALGLTAGTTQAHVSGHERVQTGTENVVVGTEQVRVGSETVVVGQESYVAGSETVVIGQETYVVGTEEVLVGQQQVVVGSEDVVVGQEQYVAGSETVVVGSETYVAGTEDVVVGQQQVVTGSETVVVGSEQVLVGTRSVVIGMDRVKIGETSTVVGSEQVKVGTKQTEIATGSMLVGLEKDNLGGLGAVTALDLLVKASPLPAGYVETLFGGVEPHEEDEEGVSLFAPAPDAGDKAEDPKGGPPAQALSRMSPAWWTE